MTREGFAALHTNADPLILCNIWDAGSAQAVVRAGAKAIATGSASLAGSLGYEDGEAITFDELLRAVRRIAAVTDLALSVDFETGFAEDLVELEANAHALHDNGMVVCKLEDRLFGAERL
ncbi:MAG: isocitrate lyase/phosphoenolpyruvate mutase family protein [Pseudomonadota bacterium]